MRCNCNFLIYIDNNLIFLIEFKLPQPISVIFYVPLRLFDITKDWCLIGRCHNRREIIEAIYLIIL